MARRHKLPLFPYLPYACFALFLAVVGTLTYEYFAHGRTSMDPRTPTLWVSALLLFIAFTAIHHLASASRKCSVCGSAKATDVLLKNGRKAWLCREDLSRSIRDGLPSIEGKWVVFAPAFEGRDDAGYVYCFEPLANFTKYFTSPELSGYAVTEVGRIKGNCGMCGKRAEVSFFGKDSVSWESDGAFDLPDFSKLHALPEYLCKKCTAAIVAEGISAASCTFENGVVLPDGTDGVLFPWEV